MAASTANPIRFSIGFPFSVLCLHVTSVSILDRLDRDRVALEFGLLIAEQLGDFRPEFFDLLDSFAMVCYVTSPPIHPPAS